MTLKTPGIFNKPGIDMKRELIVGMIALITLFLAGNTIFAQMQTVQSGPWDWVSTWSAERIPDSTDNVIINHNVDLRGGGLCNNITINPGGVIHNGNLFVYGSLTNQGTINGLGEWNGMRVYLRGNLTNSGYFESGIDFTGPTTQVVTSSDTLRMSHSYDRDAGSPINLEGVTVIKESTLFLNESQLNLSDSLKLIQSGIDGGIINGNSFVLYGEIADIGWRGAIVFGPKKTVIKNITLTGSVYFYGSGEDTEYSTHIGENVINNGNIYNQFVHTGGSTNLYIDEDFVNNGTIADQQDGLYIHFKGSKLINNGQLENTSLKFYADQIFENNSNEELKLNEFIGVDESVIVNVTKGNLDFTDLPSITDRTGHLYINMNGGKIILNANSSISLSYETYSGIFEHTDLEGNGSIINFHKNGARVGSNLSEMKITDVKVEDGLNAINVSFEGEITVLENASFYGRPTITGTLINNGTLSNQNSDVYITGTLINNGIINSDIYLDGDLTNNGEVECPNLEIKGDLYNDGLLKPNNYLTLNGTNDQSVTFGPNSELSFFSFYMLCETEGSTYQWRKDGIDIDNETFYAYQIYIVEFTEEDFGVYNCLVDGNNLSRNITIGESTPVVAMFEDFESYTDFSLSCSPWIMNDVDQSTTYTIQDVSFINAGSAMSFIVFNRNQTEPATLGTAWDAHSGEKYLACFASTSPPNNDWVISPKFTPSTGLRLSFWAKSLTDQYGLERMKVGISTTGTESGDFTFISSGDYIEVPTAWTEYTFDLSAYDGQEIHIGINCVSQDAFVFMLDDINIGAVTSIDEQFAQIPAEYSLSQNYPNPFNPSTTFSFSLPAISNVKLSVYNSLGQEVETIINNEIMNAGKHIVKFNASLLASGIYYYRMQAGSFNQTRKMILIK